MAYSISYDTATFSPKQNGLPSGFAVELLADQRAISQVGIPDTEYHFVRDRGLVSRPIEVRGVCTYATWTEAKAAHALLSGAQGYRCTIESDITGTMVADCVGAELQIQACNEPGWFVRFVLRFDEFDEVGTATNDAPQN
jgi:hypothetical protein